jgi:hypothetical protein
MLRLFISFGGRISTPAPNPNETGESRTNQDIDMNESIRARLPRRNSGNPPAETPPPPLLEPEPVSPPVEDRPRWRFKFLPAFWTIASILSLTVNVILIIILLFLWQMLGSIRGLATDKTTGLLGGLYSNFVKMDQARITRTVPVKANIPLNIVVPVQATTSITLAERAVIQNAHVVINTSSMSINAPAQVTLPAGTPLMVTLNFPLTVQNTIPVELNVPVDIPLNETELHQPFVGLQQVVKPWYCFVQPNAIEGGQAVCTSNLNPASGTVTP